MEHLFPQQVVVVVGRWMFPFRIRRRSVLAIGLVGHFGQAVGDVEGGEGHDPRLHVEIGHVGFGFEVEDVGVAMGWREARIRRSVVPFLFFEGMISILVMQFALEP